MPLLRSRYGEEKVVDGGLEVWTSDTDLTNWTELGVSAGVRDITKESTQKHGGSFAAKLQATDNDGTYFDINQSVTLPVNKYYQISGWIYFPTRTAGLARIALYNITDGVRSYALGSTNAAYVFVSFIDKPTVAVNSLTCRLLNETTTGIVYFDDISVRLIYPQRRGS